MSVIADALTETQVALEVLKVNVASAKMGASSLASLTEESPEHINEMIQALLELRREVEQGILRLDHVVAHNYPVSRMRIGPGKLTVSEIFRVQRWIVPK